jgi:hypothetical protein
MRTLALKEGGDVKDACLFTSESLIIKMIRWLVMDHSVHNDKVKTSRDHGIM